MLTKKSLWAWGLILVACSLMLRWPALHREIWNLDEANVSVYAQHVRSGDLLYRDVVDTRGPLLVYIVAASAALIGEWNLPGMHIGLALMLGLTAFLLWRIAARLDASGPGAWAAAVFTLLQIIFIDVTDTFTLHVEWFVIFFSTLAFWLLVHAWKNARPWIAGFAGLSFGLAYLAKQPGLLDCATAIIWLILLSIQSNQRRENLRLLTTMTIGFLCMAIGSPLYFASHGAWHEYQFYVWTYSTRYYLPEIAQLERLLAFGMPLRLAWANTPLLLISAILGAGLLLRGLAQAINKRLVGQEMPLLALGWIASGFFASGISGREFSHYSIQFIPGFSLLCGWGLYNSWNWATRYSAWLSNLGRGLALLPLAAGTFQISRTLSSLELAPGPEKIVGQIVRANSLPTDRIITWGFYPEVNYYAQRISASRFVFSNFQTGMIPWTNLAPEKDTAYAIIPGASDQFWQDLNRHPPAMIVDSGANRGYAKYPLEHQSQLWAYIQKSYIQIEAEVTYKQGFRIFQRISRPLPSISHSEIFNPSLNLQEEMAGPIHTGILHAYLPPGFSAAELLVNGRSTGAVTVLNGQALQLTFTAPPNQLHEIQHYKLRAQQINGAMAAGPAIYLNPKAARIMPIIQAGEFQFPAVVADCLASMIWMPERQVFSAHAPARMVFDRPPAVQKINFTFGLFSGAEADPIQPTDGIELQVSFQPTAGSLVRLFTKALDPLNNPSERGPQLVQVTLPGAQPGQLVIVISPGRRSDATRDWSYISNIQAESVMMSYGATQRLLCDSITPLGLSMMSVDSRSVIFAHAPTTLEFELESSMQTISGVFGLLDSSWNTPNGKTVGIDFIAEQVSPNGQVTTLWRRRLSPATEQRDRGIQGFNFILPTPAHGRIRFKTAPAHPPDNSFGYSYWSDLNAKSASAK